tara:strand:- start:384 stop:563 length:180 start_codon:yes stop_codon:yes gene_type:complete
MGKKIYKSFDELTEIQKDEIIQWIVIKEQSIRSASMRFNIPYETINKIFSTRYKNNNNK